MKHIFVINPGAGKRDGTKEMREKIRGIEAEIDSEIYITRYAGDATEFVMRWCEAHREEAARFYACGGDGTLNEVATGLMRMPTAHKEVTHYPCGSGNDYVKCFGKDFYDISKLVHGEAKAVDIMQIGNRYCINVCNIGLEARVCKTMIEVRRKPIIGGSNAYMTGIVRNLLTGFNMDCEITIDGNDFHKGTMLLATLSNGQYVGGGYHFAPRSVNDDGLMDVLLFRPMTLPTMIKKLPIYQRGKHFEDAGMAQYYRYARAEKVEVRAAKTIDLCIDGEMLKGSRFEIQNLKRAIPFTVAAE